jgi:hypothetical protein
MVRWKVWMSQMRVGQVRPEVRVGQVGVVRRGVQKGGGFRGADDVDSLVLGVGARVGGCRGAVLAVLRQSLSFFLMSLSRQ